MPRLPRLQYAGAIYHIVTRGDGRRKLFHDDGHFERFTRGLAEEVDRSGWIVIAYCWMPNHIHALIKTPQPNLCQGMLHWLSGYANWYAKRNRRSGHLFQGRYRAFPVEDEGYYWNLSRYIHLNPCEGSNPLAKRPEDYRHSNYGGYARKSRQVDWVAYADHHRYWAGLHGGKDPVAAYRKFVKEGLANPPDPKLERGLSPGSDSGFGIQTQSLFHRCHLPRHISVRFGETLPAFYQVRCAIRMAYQLA
jgi:putative transposase